ncbi:sensor histidine kinase [Lachnoanaerobaculum gingivalis]|uniref:Sensor histidine kinase n=1 Tax=Lachnoanaerobaculum gingivalis TaxID=2490855 RepID=A0A3P3QT24_9FIRM|nr:histidine kinase [Lachnoanaerobaculum gingivalis]RRJ24394.1 sensor histidine kinase [Lachnoanaerobaculum gingivalis]
MPIIRYVKNFIFSKYHHRLIFSFLICTLLPLILMGSVLYSITHKIAGDSILNSIILADDQLSIRINNRLNQAEKVSNTIQYDMYSLMQKMSDTREDFAIISNVRDNISLLKSTFDFYHIDIFLDDKNIAASEGLFFHPLSDLRKTGLEDIINSNQKWIYKKQYNLPYVINNTKNTQDVIACFNVLNNQVSGNTEYVYLVLLRTDELSKMLQESFDNVNLTGYIIDQNGTVISHTSKELIGTKINNIDLNINSDNTIVENSSLYYHIVVLDNGWYHITEIPKNYIFKHIYTLLRTFIIIIFLSVPVILLVIFFTSINLTDRISKLSSAMDNFKLGKKSIDVDYISALDNNYSLDEVDKLGLTFLNMQSSINKNMQSILELTLSEEKLKYQLLQSQINPHFLYNILGTIQTCQTIGKIDIANRMISNLTRFYRMSLRKSDEKIKIKDELEISKLYLEMEQLCRQDTLSWTINAEEGIENFLICKFTLQPFLENSILHGYSSEKTNIHININICYGDDEVIITIEDNGCGIPNDKLEQIRYKLSNHIVDYNQHFGICNVNKRISNTDFGNGIVLIESEERKGTKIIIKYAQMEDFS